MAIHLPGTLWSLRGPGVGPQPHVRTADERTLVLTWPAGESGYAYELRINRRDARLLARRINQCLDATRSKQ